MIRVGVIGAGNNTRNRHIPGLQAIDGVSVEAVCNRTFESSQRVCDEFNIPRAADDPYTLLDDGQLDAIVIGTWPYKHCEYTVASLERGKHVMCEARMAMNADEAWRMLEAADQRPDLAAQIVPAPFSLHYDDIVRECVDDQLGRLISVRAKAHLGPFPDHGAEKTWRRDRALSGHNIMAIGIHYETIMRWVGPLKTVTAQAHTVVETGDVPDHVNLMGTLAKDDAAFTMSATAVASAFDTGSSVWLHGEDAAVHVDLDAGAVRLGRRGEDRMQPVDIASRGLPGWRVEEEFIDAIRGVAPIRLTDFKTGVAYMRFTDAIHESAKAGRTIEI